MSAAAEHWVPIEATGNRWAISNLGRIKRLIACKCPSVPAGTIRAGTPQTNGYLHLHGSLDSKPYHLLVHRLVLEAFVGPCPEGHQVGHLNGNRQDNRLENLAYVTPAENQAHRVLHGTDHRGEQCHLAKLTADDVRTIRQSADSHASLGRRFNVSPNTIASIRQGRTWAHVERDLHKHAFAAISASFTGKR